MMVLELHNMLPTLCCTHKDDETEQNSLTIHVQISRQNVLESGRNEAGTLLFKGTYHGKRMLHSLEFLGSLSLDFPFRHRFRRNGPRRPDTVYLCTPPCLLAPVAEYPSRLSSHRPLSWGYYVQINTLVLIDGGASYAPYYDGGPWLFPPFLHPTNIRYGIISTTMAPSTQGTHDTMSNRPF